MTRPFEALFDPRSVAVVGASARPGSWGNWLARGALAGADRRRVHLINRRGGALSGVDFVPSLAAIDEPVDLVVLATPAADFEACVDDALAAGARALVGVTAGLAREQEKVIAGRVRAAGAVLLGPNCMGVADAAAGLRLLWGDLPAGDIALVSQSGNLAIELGAIARRAGLGFSRFASLGDAVDVQATDLVRVCAAHSGTRSIALYLEDVGDGRAFLAAAADAIDAGIPVVLLTAGRSAAGAAAARSHTGALATDAAVLAAACRDAGVRLVQTPTELIEATRVAALTIPRPRPPESAPAALLVSGISVGVVADGGGHGVLATDLAVAAGLAVPGFSDALRDRLAALLPDPANTANPVDLAGAGERDMTTYAAVTRAVLDSGEVDAVLLTGYFGAYAEHDDRADAEAAVADAITAAVRDTGRPVFVHSLAAGSATARRLAAAGVPVWGAIEYAVQALAASTGPVRRPLPTAATLSGTLSSCTVCAIAGRTHGDAAGGDRAVRYTGPGGSVDQGRVVCAVSSTGSCGCVDEGRVVCAVSSTGSGGTAETAVDRYWTGRELVGAAGVAFAPALAVRTRAEALAAAERIGYPVVLKALGLAHKSDVGGVVLDLVDPVALGAAIDEMGRRLDPAGFSVEAMADLGAGVEVLVGARRDPRFGPVVLVGLGGILAEVVADTAVALAPVDLAAARRLLDGLRGSALLRGFRGRPVPDLDALADVVVRVSALAAARPDIAELDLNPVLATPDGAIALDVHLEWV